MDFKKQFAVDKEAAEKGKWFPLADEGQVRVARLGNAAFKAEVLRLKKPHTHALRHGGGQAIVDLLNDITCKAMARTILVDWANIKMDGVDIPYSQEKAYELLRDYPDFQETISVLAVERDNFSPEDKEEVVGK